MVKPIVSNEPVVPPEKPCRKRMHRCKATGELPGLLDLVQVGSGIDVGGSLRELRLKHRLSIRALAEKSGLNVNTLSLIENGKTSPSVATLQLLALALEIPITAFFATETPRTRIAYLAANQRRKASFAHGTLEDLSAGMEQRGAQPFLVALEPQADSGATPIVHTGREIVFCLEGRLEYQIDNEVYVLEAGDSLVFEAHLPHRWRNVGDSPSRSLLVLCPVDEHDHPDEKHFTMDHPGEISALTARGGVR